MNQAGPGRARWRGWGTGRLGLVLVLKWPGEKSVGLPEAEAGAITSTPSPQAGEEDFQEVTPEKAAWVQTSASGWLSTNSGQVPISWKDHWACGVERRPTEVLKSQVALCPHRLGRSAREPVCRNACSLEHVYTGVFWVTGLSLDPFLPHWGLASLAGPGILAGPGRALTRGGRLGGVMWKVDQAA